MKKRKCVEKESVCLLEEAQTEGNKEDETEASHSAQQHAAPKESPNPDRPKPVMHGDRELCKNSSMQKPYHTYHTTGVWFAYFFFLDFPFFSRPSLVSSEVLPPMAGVFSLSAFALASSSSSTFFFLAQDFTFQPCMFAVSQARILLFNIRPGGPFSIKCVNNSCN